MIDDRTTRLNLALPVNSNTLKDDCERLRQTISTLDGIVATIDENGKVKFDQVPDELINNAREQWRRQLADIGLNLVAGSFEEGATANTATDAVWHIAGSQCYTWAGTLPKTVSAESSPEATGGVAAGAWVSTSSTLLKDAVSGVRDDLVGVIFPHDISKVASVGDTVPVGVTHLHTQWGLFFMSPSANGAISSVGQNTAVIGGTTVYLEKRSKGRSTKLSDYVSSGADVTALLPVLWSVFDRIDQDINFTLTNNVKVSSDNKKLFNVNQSRITLTGSAFDVNFGALELTGNNTEVRDLYFTGTADVTPLRMGNTAYGSTDATRRVKVRSTGCTFDGTGHKGPNHGNFVVIGAIDPKIKSPRFIGQAKAGGNMEILGCSGGYVRNGYAENGLLVNYHATSADGAGFPTTNFSFIDCVGIHNAAHLGAVDDGTGTGGTIVGANNNVKISRGCTGCSVVRGEYQSIANGAFNGNDHAVFFQGVDQNRAIDVNIYMQGNGPVKSAYGLYSHSASMTGSSDNVIKGGLVRINTPGTDNRIVNIRSEDNQPIRRNRIEGISFNCYNGSSTVAAVVECYGTSALAVNDNFVIGCRGLGVAQILRHRANVGLTTLSGNSTGANIDTYTADSGSVALISSPVVLNINGSGVLTSVKGATAVKVSPGVWDITFPISMANAGFSFSSPGTGRYCTIAKTSATLWRLTTYSNAGAVSDLECSLVVQ